MLFRFAFFAALPAAWIFSAAAGAAEPAGAVELDARKVEDDGVEIRAVGDTRARFSDWLLQAATLRYNRQSGFLSAEGGLTVRGRAGDEVRGDSLRYAPGRGDGEIVNFESSIGDDNLRASGDRLEVRGRRTLRAENAVITSCPAGDEDWRIIAAEFQADNQEQTASVKNARFEIAGLPVFYFPYAAYGRGGDAGSGPLPPRGRLRDNGVEAALPYRWRFAERHAYIVAPAWFSGEGWLWKNKLAYDGENANWQGEFDWTPLEDERRSRRRFRHNLRGGDWSVNLEYDRVSDFAYLRELGAPNETSVRNLPHRAEWTRAVGGWQLAAAVEKFQTLENPESLAPPHSLLPALSARHDGESDALGADWFGEIEYAKFVRAHGGQRRGGRILTDAEVGRRANFGALSVRPVIGFRAARYHGLKGGGEDEADDDGPIYAVPNFHLQGEISPAPFLPSSPTRDYRARFGYGYSPHRRQAGVPVFDAAVAQRSAENLFHWNRFSGGDRAADSHYIAYGLEGRFWDAGTNRESLFFLVAQRVNFRDARVRLPDEKSPPEKGAENLLAEWRARPLDFLRISGDAEWNLDAGRFARLYNNWTAEFSGNRLLRAGFLLQDEQRGGDEAGDSAFFGGGAPLHSRLDMAFQARYLLDERRLSEAESAFVLRDDCDCWNIFVSARRQIVERGATETTFSFGVEFSGLGKLGSVAHENLIGWLRE